MTDKLDKAINTLTSLAKPNEDSDIIMELDIPEGCGIIIDQGKLFIVRPPDDSGRKDYDDEHKP